MPLYVGVDTHPMLTRAATGLAPAVLAQHQIMAESLLGLHAPIYDVPADVERITLAIAVQINFQVAQGIDPLYMSSAASQHAKQSNVFLDRIVNPQAAQLVAQVVAQYPGAATDPWGRGLTSLRTRGGTG